MAWTQKNTDVVIKAIGTVESSFDYGAINYNDPITVGVAQWFGNRAYSLLDQMRTADPSRWANVAASLRSQIEANSVSWPARYLTRVEGESLRPLLRGNKAIQNAQFSKDIEGYLDVARSWNLDPDVSTEAVMFFCTTYHQGPARTLDIVRSLPNNTPTLMQYYNATMANPVLGQYVARQNKVLDIIQRMDSDGVDSEAGSDVDNEPTPADPDTRPSSGRIKYVEQVGDHLNVHLTGGNIITAYHSTPGRFIARDNDLGGVTGGGGAAGGDDDGGGDSDPAGDDVWHDPVANPRCTNAWGPYGYSTTGYHTGIDMAAKRAGVAGDDIFAVHDGTIVRTGGHAQVLVGHSGRGVILDIGRGYFVYYGHLNSVNCSQGQKVSAGQKIATMGGTGANLSNSDFAIHLHLSIFKASSVNSSGATIVYRTGFIDPEEYLQSKGVLASMNACPRY